METLKSFEKVAILSLLFVLFTLVGSSYSADKLRWSPSERYISWASPTGSFTFQTGYRYMIHAYETGWGEWPDDRYYTQVLIEKTDGYLWQAGTPILTLNDLTPYDTQEQAWEAGETWASLAVTETTSSKIYMHHTVYPDHLWGHIRCAFYKFPVYPDPVHNYTMSSHVSPAQISADGTSWTDVFVQLYKDGSPYGGEDGSEHTEYIKINTDKGSFSDYEDVKETWMFYSQRMGESIPLYADTTQGTAHITLEWWAHQDDPIVQNLTVKMGEYFLTITADPEALPSDGTSTSQIAAHVEPYNGTLGSTVTLTTDRGTFSNSSNTIDISLDGSGNGTAVFVAPTEIGFCHISGQYVEATDTARILAEGKTLQLTVSPDNLPADSNLQSKVQVRLLDEYFEPLGGETITLTTNLGVFENDQQTITVTSDWDWVTILFYPEDGVAGIATIQASYQGTNESLTATEEIELYNSRLFIQCNPDWLHSDGQDEAEVMVSLFLGSQPAGEGGIIWLHTDKGTLSFEETSGSTLMLETNGGGMVTATLTAAEDPGLATITAEYLPAGLSAVEYIPMTEYEFDGEILSVSATGVPAQTAGQTQSVEREKIEEQPPAEATLYGGTEVKFRVALTDPYYKLDVAYKKIQIDCSQRDLAGSSYISLPTSDYTNDSGVLEFTMTAQNLYELEGAFNSITVIATANVEPPLEKVFTINIIDNLDLLMSIYRAEIMEGSVIGGEYLRKMDQGGFSANFAKKMYELMDVKFLGHMNNALSGWLFDWVPGGWNNAYDQFVCGAYQQQVLALFDGLRLNKTTYGQTSWLLNGLDYAPLGIAGGAHLAAMIYPRVSGPDDWAGDNTLVLDPWLTQTPQSYTWDEWHDALGAAGLGLPGLVAHPWSLYGAPYLNNFYPANGMDYPPDISAAPVVLDMYEVLFVDCPVYVTIQDAEGRLSGYDPNGVGDDILKYEIPDVWRDTIGLDDGTTGWYFELPKDVLTVTLTGYGNGPVTVTRIGSEGRFEQYRHVTIADGQTCQLLLDPNHPELEVMIKDNGKIVLSDDSLGFGTWDFNESAGQSQTQLAITNTSDSTIYAPLRMTVDELLPSGMSIMNADGVDGNGKWYWDFDGFITGGQLLPGQEVSRMVSFAGVDPNGFDILITLRGYGDGSQNTEVLCARKDFSQGIPECGDGNHPYPAGDINRDCRVNNIDMSLLSEQWLNDHCGEKYDCWNSDKNSSGIVDISDFMELVISWLSCNNPADCS